jgi:nicotinamide riboside kinase
MTPRLICVAGAESTGKSWLAQRLADHFGWTAVPEYGRDYCLIHGNDISMAELVHIGETQERMMREAVADAARAGQSFVIADTDALVTAIWADMMFGVRDDWFAGPRIVADLHLVTANDIPWERDSIRVYGADVERDRFRGLLVGEIERHGGRRVEVRGEGPARIASALDAITHAFPEAARAANGAG